MTPARSNTDIKLDQAGIIKCYMSLHDYVKTDYQASDDLSFKAECIKDAPIKKQSESL